MKPIWQRRLEGLMKQSRYLHVGGLDIPAGKESKRVLPINRRNWDDRRMMEPTPADHQKMQAGNYLSSDDRQKKAKITMKEQLDLNIDHDIKPITPNLTVARKKRDAALAVLRMPKTSKNEAPTEAERLRAEIECHMVKDRIDGARAKLLAAAKRQFPDAIISIVSENDREARSVTLSVKVWRPAG